LPGSPIDSTFVLYLAGGRSCRNSNVNAGLGLSEALGWTVREK
jgi:hypothetical protein